MLAIIATSILAI